MYHFTVKSKGKRVTIATWIGGPGTCQATASHLFFQKGFNEYTPGASVCWDSVTSQKNWAGYAPDCKHFTDAPEAVEYPRQISKVESLRRLGYTDADILEDFPQLANMLSVEAL